MISGSFRMVREDVMRLAEGCAARHSAHVVDVAIRGSGHKAVVEVYVDAEVSVTTELCAAISREVAQALDAQNIISGSYQLVVSSPGIDRPLRFPWQYHKHIGRKLMVRSIKEGVRRQVAGKLLSTNDAGLVMESGTERTTVLFSDIEEAKVIAAW
jgi:ribosome maturation factor RimP